MKQFQWRVRRWRLWSGEVLGSWQTWAWACGRGWIGICSFGTCEGSVLAYDVTFGRCNFDFDWLPQPRLGSYLRVYVW